MNRVAIYIVLLSSLFNNSIFPQDIYSEVKIADVTIEDLTSSPTYEDAKERGKKMSLSQLLELKSKLLELTEKLPPDNEEDIVLIDYSHSILANGLYAKSEKYTEDLLSELRTDLLLHFKNHANKKWDQENNDDLILYKKYSLFRNLLEDILYTSTQEKNYDFCLHIIKENHSIPFVGGRTTIIKYFVNLYNKEDIPSTIKTETEKIFPILINIENEYLKVDTGQDDYIYSQIESKSLLKVLQNRKEIRDKNIINIP